jgi:acyl-CoA oxidase
MTFLHREAVDRFAAHTEEEREEAERLAAIAKGWITWQARDITTECRERCGAQGLFPANDISDLPANIEGGITAEGDNLVIWVKAASEMVFGHETAKPEAARAGDLTEHSFLRGLLAQVEAIWQARARTALREGPSGDALGRWNVTSEAALKMVSAHARLQAADAFAAAADRATDPKARLLLHSLCRLFLLRTLREHTGDLLAEGHLTPDQVRALPKTLDTLVADLAPHMMTLVDAFDFPSEMLSAIPIASGTGRSHGRWGYRTGIALRRRNKGACGFPLPRTPTRSRRPHGKHRVSSRRHCATAREGRGMTRDTDGIPMRRLSELRRAPDDCRHGSDRTRATATERIR